MQQRVIEAGLTLELCPGCVEEGVSCAEEAEEEEGEEAYRNRQRQLRLEPRARELA